MFSKMKHWVTNTFSKYSRLRWFKDVLSVYKYSFFDQNHDSQELVETVLGNDTMYDKMKSTSVWVAYEKNNTDMKKIEIAKTLLFRYPVYFGEYIKDWINVKKANEVFPYLKEIEDMNIEPSTIYTLGSLILSKNKWIGMLHTWGINFESTETYDYQHFVHKQKINFSQYEKRTREMFFTVFRALEKMIERNHNNHNDHYERVYLRIPLLGLGSYLAAISSEKEKEMCRKVFFRVLKEISSRFIKTSKLPLKVFLCHRDSSNVFDSVQSSDSFEISDNLFEISNDPTTLDVIVNAWDSSSFIGNGGSKDPTIDGFVGAGLDGYIECAAYAQNIFFLPELAYQLELVDYN